ncbi:MAG: substrate-binding domain-containing protein, partial [Chloroflexota bacterium]
TPLLRRARADAALTQGALASRAAISRQAYAAIEAGTAAPSTPVALRIAHALGTTVEALFGEGPPPEHAHASTPAPSITPVGAPRTGARSGFTVTHGIASALATGGPGTLVLAGCDPTAPLLAAALAAHGVALAWREAPSRAALMQLARGEAQVAGAHLRDPITGGFNHAWVRRLLPAPATLVTFAVWEQGLLVAPGNPHGLRTAEDLARPGLRIVNRPLGAGARALLDAALEVAGVPGSTVNGYAHELPGHLAVAEAVAASLADAGVGVRSAAIATGLDFVPLTTERYDLVIPTASLDEPAVQRLLAVLGEASLRARVEALGYDGAGMGTEPSAA